MVYCINVDTYVTDELMPQNGPETNDMDLEMPV